MTDVVPKVIGADFELANMLLTPGQNFSRANRAAELLLGEIHGFPRRRYSRGTAIELDRRFIPGSGGSAYIDSDHLELNTPEHLRSRDHAGQIHACLQIARRAQRAASRQLPRDTRLCVLANNCDGHVSYGRHLNVMTTGRCFDNILYRKPHLAGFLASHLVTSVIYSGQGMVGAANGRSACDYQLSQRADWFERLAGIDTMQRRPLLNTRDESHAADGLARLHLIYYDMVMSPIANRLQAGTTQLVVAMCEAGWADAMLQLDDPVGAASLISRDLSLAEPLVTAVRGRRVTALELQQELADLSGEFVASGIIDDSVIPDAGDIVACWRDTLQLLRGRELDEAARRCDNWLKYLLLDRQRQRRNLSWRSPELKVLDLQFSSVDPSDSLFFQMCEAGAVEGMPGNEEIDRFIREPPDETRAFLRAHVLRRFGEEISQMDWSWIEFRVPSTRGWWAVARLSLPDPGRHNRQDCAAMLDNCQSLDDLVGNLAMA